MPHLQAKVCSSLHRPGTPRFPKGLTRPSPDSGSCQFSIFRMNSDYLFTLFYSCISILVMAALNAVCLRLANGIKVPVETLSFCSIFVNFVKQNICHFRHITAWSHLFWFPFCGGTGGCQTMHRCTLMMI
jgi:hypothetical protein